MINFKNLNKRLIIYIIFFVVSAGFIAGLLGWAFSSSSEALAEAAPAEVLLDYGVRREYLAGEEVESDGVKLQADGVVYSDCTVTCDTSSAGIKRVDVTYSDENVNLKGSYSVEVYKVRHYDLRVFPDRFHRDGSYEGNFVLWADLSGSPKEFAVPDRYSTVVVVPKDIYEVTVEPDENDPNGYGVTLSYGSTELSYYFVDLETQVIQLNSYDRVLDFTNTNGGSETLKLYVTQIENNGYDGENGAEGYYVFTSASGESKVLRFKFYLTGYESHFCSETFGEGMKDVYNSNEGFDAIYGGVTFHADKASWHKAVLGE